MKRNALTALLFGTLAAAIALPQGAEAADCYAVGQRIAAQQGGSLAAAQAGTRGGRPVCVIVVLVPGKDGQRPKRQEIVVPQ